MKLRRLITKQENANIVKEIENLSPELIEKNNHVELTKEEKDIRRAIITYGEIACWASSRRRNEGRQKCDFRGTLKNSVNSLEAIIGLRRRGLPSNSHAPGDDLHRTYVLGIQSWGKQTNIMIKFENLVTNIFSSHAKGGFTKRTEW
ncbi:13966_t:CDS:2 [Funneliformis geosporum]|nr:13966_t:CDS:2 [Funneliformis geosporum]